MDLPNGTEAVVTVGEFIPPQNRSTEFVERKGLGHPDTMADLLADVFSFEYADYCLKKHGVVPNHWVDKVTLVGAEAHIDFGDYDIIKPVRALLLGKITEQVGDAEIPLDELFRTAATEVLIESTRDPAVADYLRTETMSVTGRTTDHHPHFYEPDSAGDLSSIIADELVSNDSVLCIASAGQSPLEGFVLDLERAMQSTDIAAACPGIGTDIKVLAARLAGRIDISMCVPFHPTAVGSWHEYKDCVSVIRELIHAAVDELCPFESSDVEVFLNTKDRPGRGYLAPFGTALGKGDCGMVGRGNRGNGLISGLRCAGVEAPSGKNPIHHAGRLYNIAAQHIADDIYSITGVNNEVVITSHVGAPLEQPATVSVNLAAEVKDTTAVSDIAANWLSRIPVITESLLAEKPLSRIAQFREARPVRP